MPTKEKACSRKTKRKWLFRGMALFGSLVVIELLSCAGLKLLGPLESTTLASLHEAQHAIATGLRMPGESNEVIHPYLGWVHNPQVARDETVFGTRVSVNALGFQDNNRSIFKRSDDKIIVGILGGSVAWHTGIVGAPIIRKTLESDPRFQDKTIEVVVLAKSGYKQPQQLLTYNYLTSIGGEFDAIVNIDGYNEVALAVCDNYQAGISMAYPRAWRSRAIQLVDPRDSADAFRLFEMRAHRQAIARTMNHPLLKWSWTANLVWYLRNRRAESKYQELGHEVFNRRSGEFIYYGPPDNFSSEKEMQQGVVDLWFRSSLQLHASCTPSGTIYLHVLQPNQYHLGSKPMGPEEKRAAFADFEPTNKPIREIYPLLIEAGRKLKQRGVRFSDQTMLFAEIEEPIYIDGWCHYNKRGNELLAQQVADALLSELTKSRSHETD